MSGADFLRLAQPGILVTLGGLFFVLLVAWFVTRQAEIEERTRVYVRRARNLFVVVFAAAFIWQLFAMASVNVAPRSVIDRSDVDASNRNFNNR